MPAIAAPSFWLRIVPVKVTMAPMSVRPAVRQRTSAPRSKSSRWTRTLKALASRHRRKEGDLARTGEAGGRLDMRLVDGGADDVGAGEGLGVLRPQSLEPRHQLSHGGNVGRKVQHL